jgi:hypothetical protein
MCQPIGKRSSRHLQDWLLLFISDKDREGASNVFTRRAAASKAAQFGNRRSTGFDPACEEVNWLLDLLVAGNDTSQTKNRAGDPRGEAD